MDVRERHGCYQVLKQALKAERSRSVPDEEYLEDLEYLVNANRARWLAKENLDRIATARAAS